MKTIKIETAILEVVSAEKKSRTVAGVSTKSIAVVLSPVEDEYANSGCMQPFNKRIFEDSMTRTFNHLYKWLDKEMKKVASANDMPVNGNGQPLRFRVEYAVVPVEPHYRFVTGADGKVNVDTTTKVTKIRLCAIAGVESVESQLKRYENNIPKAAMIATNHIPDADDVDTAGESQATNW